MGGRDRWHSQEAVSAITPEQADKILQTDEGGQAKALRDGHAAVQPTPKPGPATSGDFDDDIPF